MIDRTHALKVGRQCELLDLQRSTFYYQPKTDHSKSLVLMHKINSLHLDFPFDGRHERLQSLSHFVDLHSA